MIDRERLAASRKALLRVYWMIAAAPVTLSALGWWVASASGDSTPTPARAFGIFALVTLASGVAVLVGVPLLRAWWRGADLRSPAVGATLPARLTSRLFIELALWQALAMFGFTAVFVDEPVTVLFGASLVALAGILYSYPRWSAWEDAADAADRRAGHGPAAEPALPADSGSR